MTIAMPVRPGFKASSFFLETNTQTFESPLTRATQRLELAGQRWLASYTLRKMNRVEAAPWIAFFLSLKGRADSFHAVDPDWEVNLGAWTGVPLVNGASQTGNSLIIDGVTASVTNWAMAGDYFSVNNELKRVTVNAGSSAGGAVTLTFEPYLRTAPADNAAITRNPATCSMIMTSDTVGEWNSNYNKIYDEKTFSAYEVF